MQTDVFARRLRLQAEEDRYRTEILHSTHTELTLLHEEQRERDRNGDHVVPVEMWARYRRAAIAADVAAGSHRVPYRGEAPEEPVAVAE